jgi:hypothetical protein
MTGESRLHDVFQVGSVLFAIWLCSYQLFGCDKKARRSPTAFRRERAFRHAELAAQRYATLPPARRVVNEEKRWARARRSAFAAVSWALLAKDFSRDEIAGAVVLAVHQDREVVFDHDRLYESCLQILRRATLEEGS